MKIIVTRQNQDGTFDECGMNNRALFSNYKTLKNALKFGAKGFANGKPCRIEVYPGGSFDKCNWVLLFDADFNRAN